MTWQYTSEVFISLLTFIIAIIIALISLRWWKTIGIPYYSGMMLFIGGWALFSGLETGSVQIAEKIFWAKIQYVSISLIAILWFLFVLQYTHQEKRIPSGWVISLFAFPLTTIYTSAFDESHHWLWRRIAPISSLQGSSLDYTPGWWFYLFMGLLFLIVLVGASVLIRKIFLSPRGGGGRSLLLLIGLIPPLIANYIYQARILPGVSMYILIMVGLVVSGLIYIWGIYYFQTVDSISLSHDVVIDRLSEGVIVLDREDRIHDINSTALSMLGISERSAKQKRVNDIIRMWPALGEAFKALQDVETEVNVEGNSPRTLTLRTTNLKDKSGKQTGKMIVWRDITQYRQVESTLRESEARFKALFQGAPDAIIITDKGNRVILMNNLAITLFGYTLDELKGQSIDVVIPERYREAYYKYLKAFTDEIETRPGISLPLNGLRKNGREIPIEIALSPVKVPAGILFTNIIRDLSNRQEAEEQLRLQSIALESAANGIVITDRDGNIQWVNPAFAKMTGYSVDDVLGKNTRILKSGLVPKERYESLWKTILSGNVWHGELINRRKDGTIITEEQTIAPVRDNSGQIIHFIAIKQDITERKRAEEALSKRTDQIATLNRVMRTVSSTLEQSTVLDTILREIQQIIPYDSASVWLCKDDFIEIIAAHGFTDPENIVGASFKLSSVDNPNTSVILGKQPVIIGDAYTSFSSFRTGVHAKYRHRGWMGVPMILSEQVIGMLSFDKKIPNYYTQEQAQFALAFAAQAAIAIENARLYSTAQKDLVEKIKTEEKLLKLQKDLEEQAIRDSLTGLYNRRFLDETLSRELSRAERDKYSVSLVMVDLDRFKVFNDTYGHDVGDLMLKKLGKLLTEQVRAGDIACRYGGEEFVVVMPKASLSVARQRANDWRTKFESQILIHDGEVLSATLSAGVAVYPLHGSSAEEMVRRADQAMYAAKSAGRNQVVIAE